LSERYGSSHDWRYEAACRNKDTEDWYPDRDRETYTTIAARARAICNGGNGVQPCSVRLECLLSADKIDEEHGIWGGLSHRERNARKRKAIKAGMTLEEWILANGFGKKSETLRKDEGLLKK